MSAATGRLGQIELMRIPAMAGVVVVHSISATQPASSIPAAALLMLLHVNRDVFFFVTAFVLQLTSSSMPPLRFWRRRYPVVLVPYLAWSIFYIVISGDVSGPAGLPAATHDLMWGWFAMYFLVVTMQFYAVFPALAWLLKRTGHRGHLVLLAAVAAVQLIELALLHYGGVPGWLGSRWSPIVPSLLPTYIFWFVAGALAAVHREQIHAWLARNARLVIGLVVASVAAAEGVFVVGLRGGMTPVAASGAVQPVVMLTGTAAIVGIWLLGSRLLVGHGPGSAFWRAIAWCSDVSFGVFLVHVLFLRWAVLPLERAAGVLDAPGIVSAAVTVALVLPLSALFTRLARGTPLSLLLTGRRRRVMVRPGPHAVLVPES
jgi:peptidoglycan/LPS O-acetylase OafA/YrhL